MKERWKLLLLVAAFGLLYYIPLGDLGLGAWLNAGFGLLHEYAREHVLTCLVPAFFIAGAVAVFLNKDAVLKYLGPSAKAIVSYPIAGLSGGILAVCSCTILPLFAGIYKRGAGLGPAVAFLFTGPAINVTAIFLTVSVLGWEFAVFRLVAALFIAIVAGVVMSAVFERKDTPGDREAGWMAMSPEAESTYPIGKVALFLGAQLSLLVVLGLPGVPQGIKWSAAAILLLAVVGMTFSLFDKRDRGSWMEETWFFTKQIMPYLFVGVFLAGLISVVLPPEVVGTLVGGNGVGANAVASVSGALMYFATLTEIPILQALMKLGMGNGPAMALLLTGNALSVPNLIVLHKILGIKKTATYLSLTVAMSIIAGVTFGVIVS